MKPVSKDGSRPQRMENAGPKDDLDEQNDQFPRKQSPSPNIWDELYFLVNRVHSWKVCSSEILTIRNPQI